MMRGCKLSRAAALLLLAASAVRAEPWPTGDEPRLQISQQIRDFVEPGKPFLVDLCIRNTGKGDARSVQIYDELPAGAEVVDCVPIPVRQHNLLTWTMPTLRGGDQYNIRLRLRSDRVAPKGEWYNKVRMGYQSEIGNLSVIDMKRPRLTMTMEAPRYAWRGEQLPLTIRIKNDGTWTGHRLTLSAQFQGGLAHEAGAELENEIGDMAAGQSCDIALPLRAVEVGKANVVLRLTSDEGVERLLAGVAILDARPELAISGPSALSAGWACTYNFTLTNSGTDALPACQVQAEVPKNISFARAAGGGRYDARSHTVTWSVPECKPGQSLTCIVSGTAVDGPCKDGCLKVLDHRHVLKRVPWSLKLIESPGEGLPQGRR